MRRNSPYRGRSTDVCRPQPGGLFGQPRRAFAITSYDDFLFRAGFLLAAVRFAGLAASRSRFGQALAQRVHPVDHRRRLGGWRRHGLPAGNVRLDQPVQIVAV